MKAKSPGRNVYEELHALGAKRSQSRELGDLSTFDPKIAATKKFETTKRTRHLLKARILKHIDRALTSMGFDQESLKLTRDQVTMILYKIGYVQSFNKEESQATNRLCNIIETPKEKEINSRDLKIMLLGVHKLWFEWMRLTKVNVEEEEKTFREVGYMYEEKFYLNSLEDVKTLHTMFVLFLDNKKSRDTRERTKR